VVVVDVSNVSATKES